MQVPFAKGTDRFIAYAVDAGACAMIQFVLVILFEDVCNSKAAGASLFACIVFLYQWGFLAYRDGITFGKYSRHIQPISQQGEPLTPMQKFLRALLIALPYFLLGAERSLAVGSELVTDEAHVIAMLSGLVLIAADIYPLEFHKQPRTLTDRLARTIVIQTPPMQPHRAPAFPMYSRHDAEFGVAPPDDDDRRR